MRHPNIVYILADDMGYGDVSCLNPASKIRTPHLDRIARDGMAFTDAHASSAVCTPSRYSILTGRYNWRSWLKSHVTHGYARPLIEPGRMTVASLLRDHGYATACVGKWHLGWDWGLKPGAPDDDPRKRRPEDVDFTRPITGGPTDCGFDRFFGISASLDMPPYVYLDNGCSPMADYPELAAYGHHPIYDLVADIGERRNVQAEHPEVVARLTALLTRYVAEGRSTPGAPQPNTGETWWQQLWWMQH